MKKPNVIIAGDAIYAGIDEEDITKIKNAVVIEFESKEQMGEALRARKFNFDFMRFDDDDSDD